MRQLFIATWFLLLLATSCGHNGDLLIQIGATGASTVKTHSFLDWAWRTVAYQFLHGSFTHWASNSIAMWFLWPQALKLAGNSRVALMFVFLITGTAAGIATTYWGTPLSVGASGSLCGIVGFALGAILWLKKQGVDSLLPLKSVLIGAVTAVLLPMIPFLWGGSSAAKIDHVVHIVGLFSGVLISPIVSLVYSSASYAQATLSHGDGKNAPSAHFHTAAVRPDSFLPHRRGFLGLKKQRPLVSDFKNLFPHPPN